MSGRTRSPSYPSTSLGEAIDLIKKLHDIERTNPIDREVAAKALGYSGISGRSATILSNLNQYGLLERSGKNEVKVTGRAVEILYPDSSESKADALHDAATEPELFQRIKAKFTDGMPSENALEAFLFKQDFTHAAITPAIKAFQETFSFLENETVRERTSDQDESVVNYQSNQNVDKEQTMRDQMQSSDKSSNQLSVRGIDAPGQVSEGLDIRIVQQKIWLGGVIVTDKDADEIIDMITSLKPMLRKHQGEDVVKKDDDSSDDVD